MNHDPESSEPRRLIGPGAAIALSSLALLSTGLAYLKFNNGAPSKTTLAIHGLVGRFGKSTIFIEATFEGSLNFLSSATLPNGEYVTADIGEDSSAGQAAVNPQHVDYLGFEVQGANSGTKAHDYLRLILSEQPNGKWNTAFYQNFSPAQPNSITETQQKFASIKYANRETHSGINPRLAKTILKEAEIESKNLIKAINLGNITQQD